MGLNKLCFSPDYYHREYKNDTLSSSLPAAKSYSWMETSQRVASSALPLLSLYKPLSFPLSLAMGALRTYSSMSQLLEGIKSGEGISGSLRQAVVSAAALSGTIFAHPLGMLITTVDDLMLEVSQFLGNIQGGNFEKAGENCLNIVNNSLYLVLFFQGTPELLALSLATQMATSFYHAQSEFRNGNYIEGTGHLLLSVCRAHQFKEQVAFIQQQRSVVRVNNSSQNAAVEEAEICFSDASGELKQKYIQSISEAKESVTVMTFTFSDPEIIELLLKKANEGVKVTIVINKDHMGSLLPHSSKFEILTRWTGEGRVHHKITVIDKEKVWIGSANLSSGAWDKQNNTMIYLKSKEMANALHEEMEVFSGKRERSSKPLPPVMVNGQKIELLLFPHVPFDTKNTTEKALNQYGKQRILQMIQEAKKSLRFAVCVWTDPELIQAVLEAKKRGVNVEVVVWKKADSLLGPLQAAGIPIIEKPHLNLMHNKWMIVDDESFLNCSANWSKSWFSRNDESSIVIEHLTKMQRDGLLAYWQKLVAS